MRKLGLLAVVLAVALVAWIALAPLPASPRPVQRWRPVAGQGFRVDLPAAPVRSADEVTAVAGSAAYLVTWFPAPASASKSPDDAIAAALGRLGAAKAKVVRLDPHRIGPFPGAEVTARLADSYLHGRILIIGDRGFLVAELGPGEAPPEDLNRFLGGFDPLPAAA